MSMPLSNSLGVKFGMMSEFPTGANYYESQHVSRPPQSQYGTQYGSLGRSRPRSGKYSRHMDIDIHAYGYLITQTIISISTGPLKYVFI